MRSALKMRRGGVCVLAAMLAVSTVAAAQTGGEEHRGGAFAGMARVQGEVTAIAGDQLTLKTEDGKVETVVTTVNTKLMHSPATPDSMGGGGMGMRGGAQGAMQPIQIADVHVGDGIFAAGQMEPATHTLHALFAVVTDASVVRAMKANLGKTYITGRVQTVDLDNAKMTVVRPDDVVQTIGLDDSTSFRRGGRRGAQGDGAADSITLADIKPGDTVAGRGSVKAGVFVPAELTVMTPHMPSASGSARP